MKQIRIFKCKICGSIVVLLEGETNSLTCCGMLMEELVPNLEETSFKEKHIPVVKRMGSRVCVKIGEVEHPMISKHYINWIIIQTNLGFKINYLNYDELPETHFRLSPNEYVIRVYAYCNIHGLWVKEMDNQTCEKCKIK